MEKKTITGDFKRMKVGDKNVYPAEKCMSLRAMASTLGFMWERKYSTSLDRERRVITVTRVK